LLTLFAGFVLNFSKIFCDCDFEAKAAIFAVLRRGDVIFFLGFAEVVGERPWFSFLKM
jgi:hypothetical protein